MRINLSMESLFNGSYYLLARFNMMQLLAYIHERAPTLAGTHMKLARFVFHHQLLRYSSDLTTVTIKRLFLMVFIIFMTYANSYADTAWVIDDLRTGVFDAPSRNAGFNGTLVAGQTVKKLAVSNDGQYAHISTNELEGWVLAQNLSETPSIRTQYQQQTEELLSLKHRVTELINSESDVSKQNTHLQQELDAALAQAQHNRDALLSLQRASENVVQIDSLNRELQDKVVNLEQMNLRLTQKNTRLAEQSQHSQMIVGGVLFGCGMVTFWLLSLLSSVRRRSSFSDF